MYFEIVFFFGCIFNFYNIDLLVGGFIGGEVVLLVICGFIFGIGIDIGGLICGLVGFCGIYGYKLILYYFFIKDFFVGGFVVELMVFCFIGFMGYFLRDMDFFCFVVKVLNLYVEDLVFIFILWIGIVIVFKIIFFKVGIMWNDGVIIF